MNTATNLQEKHKASIRVMQFVILIGSIILIGRIFHLQILDYETYSPMSMQNSLRMEVVSPARGLIYDRNGVILVENEPIYSATITPSKFDSEKIPLLAEILDLPEETVRERIAAAQNYSWHRTSRLFTEVSFETFSALQENAWQLPGISHQVESKRYYPTEVKAPHVFGYMREASREEYLADDRIQLGDKVGKSGIERVYEEYMRGELGVDYIRVNAYGQSLGPYDEGSLDVTPRKGADLITTLDADLQALAEKIMVGKNGGLVAIDPQTGGILTLVSSPGYDLEKLSGRLDADYWQSINTDPGRPLFNRAVSNRQPPGSTFKPFMGLIGLHMGLITPEMQIYNPGAYYRGRAYGDLADPGNYDLELALARSSNTYFFWMMDRIATRGMLNTWSELVKDFGIGPLNHIDLPSERSGIVPDSTYMNTNFGERRWGIGDLMSLGVGQGMVSASPLQMAVAVSSLANGGYKVQPHLVQAIKNSDGTLEYTRPVMEKIEWIRPEYLEPVKKGMKRVVTEGSGRYYTNLSSLGIEVAGKTGTAQNPHGANHGWFIAYAPADNPQIAIAVLTENSGYGSISAAPVAGLLIEQYLTGEITRQHVLDYVLAFQPSRTETTEP
ncbi:MAG TPA: penicillin-binding protein 2 [Balneolaceae bacterium]|nr:penicillin-binding protein 2 [Balneolaceae bacterium]